MFIYKAEIDDFRYTMHTKSTLAAALREGSAAGPPGLKDPPLDWHGSKHEIFFGRNNSMEYAKQSEQPVTHFSVIVDSHVLLFRSIPFVKIITIKYQRVQNVHTRMKNPCARPVSVWALQLWAISRGAQGMQHPMMGMPPPMMVGSRFSTLSVYRLFKHRHASKNQS